jgi:hypothetical protein
VFRFPISVFSVSLRLPSAFSLSFSGLLQLVCLVHLSTAFLQLTSLFAIVTVFLTLISQFDLSQLFSVHIPFSTVATNFPISFFIISFAIFLPPSVPF